MPFISVSEELAKKSFTQVENKFITKYLPVLEAGAVKVYLYSLYLYQSGAHNYTLGDLAERLDITEDKARGYFEYLEEMELVSVISFSPFEVKILDAENVYGTPKKFKPEKYSGFTESAQTIICDRMISTNEFQKYFYYMDEYGFKPDALLMILKYCVKLTGDNKIRFTYIEKVISSFIADNAFTTEQVEKRLANFYSSTPALLKLFGAAGIKKQPDIDDDKLYKKWTAELGFDDAAILAAAKQFKVKSCEKLDEVLGELYKNKKFDVKEIADYCKSKNELHSATLDVAKNIGVYMQNSAPYIENYTGIWRDYGYSYEALKALSSFCFKRGVNSFERLDETVKKLYENGIIADESVNEYIEKQNKDEEFLKKILSACGLTRKVLGWDRESLARWRKWEFSDEMILKAAEISADKSNPMAYINGILASWKSSGIYTVGDLPAATAHGEKSANNTRAEVERHFYDLRHRAEEKAEKTLARATADEIYGSIRSRMNELAIELAFAELQDKNKAEKITAKLKELEKAGNSRLEELCIDSADFKPHYSCKKCNDTGYLQDGTPCECMKKFIAEL